MKFQWDEANRDHIARHNISPEEFEQVIKNGPLDLKVEYIENDGWVLPISWRNRPWKNFGRDRHLAR